MTASPPDKRGFLGDAGRLPEFPFDRARSLLGRQAACYRPAEIVMEIREIAERILFGASLEDKLLPVEDVTDLRPGPAIALPESPGRPAGLELGRAPRGGRHRAPGRTELEDEARAGLVLHQFANHELLALELMALILLRFPEAPPRFRRGLLATLVDEQRHFRLYRDRMTTFGVTFGERPLSGFFWNAMSGISSPLEFVSAMSLTFEQANLDFSRHYRDAFRRAGDEATADLLDEVYEDEIRHVGHGRRWFERWREPEATSFDAWVSVLPTPLLPGHAKGRGFDREGRRRAGLDPDFVARLAVTNTTRGRPPEVWAFEADCEAAIAEQRRRPSSLAVTRELSRDLETLPLWLAKPRDLVLVEEPPRAAHLADLQSAGVPLPEFLAWSATGDEDRPPPERRIGGLRTWGASPAGEHRLRAWRERLIEKPHGHVAPEWHPDHGRAATKSFAVALLRELLESEELAGERDAVAPPEVAGRAVESPAEALAAFEALRDAGFNDVVFKADLGASGREMIRVLEPAMLPSQLRWIEGALARQGRLVVEPWLDRVWDFSVHLDVDVDEAAGRLRGTTRFVTDVRGQYLATVLDPAQRSGAPEVLRFLNEGTPRGPRLAAISEPVARRVAEAVRATGYRGPVSFDAFVYRDAATARLRLKPLSEINLRATMGRIGHSLRRRVVSGRRALWVLVGRKDLDPSSGPQSLAALAAELERRAPRVMGTGRHAQHLRDGILCTTDPERARRMLTLLAVGDALDPLCALLPKIAKRL